MAQLSRGTSIATFHRVRRAAFAPADDGGDGAHERGRYSVPFFFEPGVDAQVSVRKEGGVEVPLTYGEFVLGKMAGWVEFQDVKSSEKECAGARAEGMVAVEASA